MYQIISLAPMEDNVFDLRISDTILFRNSLNGDAYWNLEPWELGQLLGGN